MGTHIFGIRHHGPGCARALRAALERLTPDVVLVEGPPDAHAVLPLLTNKKMRPPVALLLYVPDSPSQAVYYPFTNFSPEWQALSYAMKRGIPGRFIDLPQAVQLARRTPDEGGEAQPEAPADEATLAPAADATAEIAPAPTMAAPHEDPLALLAEAAGYADHELWWERQVEQRTNATDLFDGILEAMTALRSDLTPKDEEEALREAHMRQGIRAAEKEGFKTIAVVCGAWHAPALAVRDQARADAELLSGLKRVKVEATWIPWTNSRLAYRTGYGAGVGSPGWYEHLWTARDRLGIRWMARAARLLRDEGLDVSSASVIEAVRLTDALAAMRDLPMPGLDEMHEATHTVLCNGEEAPMRLIREKLEIGERLGEVPPETPAVPLQRDVEARQRRLRLKPTTEIEQLDLDLREENARLRSRLLHGLRLLDIEWGKPQGTYGKSGTFHEYWTLQWQVEFAVSLIEANVWGNTVEEAATARTRTLADEAQDLPTLTALLQRTQLAELPEAIEYVLARVQARAAVSADVRHLMEALPKLASVARYSDVRGTKAERVLPVIDGLFARVVVGLPPACSSLDDEAAEGIVESMKHVQQSLDLLDRADLLADWQGVLRELIARDGVHGLVRGYCCRLLLEKRALSEDELQGLAQLTLSPVTPAPQAAAWVEGVLHGSGRLLLYEDGLWAALDGWLAELAPDPFVALLPLLRRAFAGFETAERRTMGEKVKHLHAGAAGQSKYGGAEPDGVGALDIERANLVLPVLAQILGVSHGDN
ncbi:MAG TPA: DUF5682 family protein [Ktedonobacterales bacterium]|nr:DUF5682 family protein [Ktedonobacterales bacterium]